MRFSKAVFLVAVGCIPFLALADADGDGDGLRALRDRAQAIGAAAEAGPRPAWLDRAPDPRATAAGEALGREALDRLRARPPAVSACRDLGRLCGSETSDPSPQAKPAAPAVTYKVLVTRALGREALRAVFRAAAGADDVRVVFRGIAPGERLTDALREILSLLDGIEPVPNVELDPRPFRDFSVETAPVVAAEGPDGLLARVAGLSDPEWLRRQIRRGERGDLGVRGPTVEIAEPDLIEELQRRLAAVDLGALRDAALGRFWRRAAFETLPTATEPRERTVDPTVTASADLTLPDGTVLVRAGETVNPLERLPFTRRLVVFDAADPAQVETARRLGEAPGKLRPLYLASGLDRAQGWEGLRAVEDRLDEPVYLLAPDVCARFALERVPAAVEAQGRVFLVREVPPERPAGAGR